MAAAGPYHGGPRGEGGSQARGEEEGESQVGAGEVGAAESEGYTTSEKVGYLISWLFLHVTRQVVFQHLPGADSLSSPCLQGQLHPVALSITVTEGAFLPR